MFEQYVVPKSLYSSQRKGLPSTVNGVILLVIAMFLAVTTFRILNAAGPVSDTRHEVLLPLSVVPWLLWIIARKICLDLFLSN